MKRKKVVIAQSSVTAGQLEDFFRMIKDGSIGFEELKSFLENPKKFLKTDNDPAGPVTIVRAINILGDDKVFTAEAVCQAWSVSSPLNIPIYYSEKTLRACAAQNKSGKADWRLVYIIGHTLRQQRKIIGTDKNQQPCFHKDNDWYLKGAENNWNVKPVEGENYCLINFQPIGANLNYDKQELEIFQNFPECERTNPHIFGEALISIFKLRKERIAENWYHRSSVLDSDGDRVYVGIFGSDGLRVIDGWDGDEDGNLRVSVSRKFEN